jgi:hypothetical protein
MSAIYFEKISDYDPAVHLWQVGPVTMESEHYETVKNEVERIEQEVMFASRETEQSRKK